ncbi:MAG: SpoIIIAC/SpoIIIAD family protein [Clostridia bacterium]|nr:SpoIIIAC/SpoIIIAD family protein [Clostridia bacterium]
MDIEKIAAIALISCLLSLLIKDKSPLFKVLVSLGAVTIIGVFTVSGVYEVISEYTELFQKSGISSTHFKNIIKVIAIAYFTEILSSLLKDAGETALAKNFELAGKVTILIFTVPQISELLTVIIDALSLI